MIVYIVERTEYGNVKAWWRAPHCAKYPLPHVAAHSPTGFETGYGGSGPADLALSILAHHFGETDEVAKSGKAWALHQDFKRDVIAMEDPSAGESYELTSELIEQWLESRSGESNCEAEAGRTH